MSAARKKPRETSAEEKAVKIIRLFKNTKGDFAGKPFNLQKWQENEIIRPIFRAGKDGKRIVREAFIFLPRKNGKSEIAAAISLYCLLFDGEKGGEHYIAATDKDQASIVFAACAAMVNADPNLKRRCKVLDATKRIVVPETNSFLRAIPADAGGSDGFGAATVIYDELHAAPNRDLFDVLRTSQGGRSQPLFICITTAGFDKRSICYERYQYACKVRDGIIKDPAFLPVIYEAEPDEDWTDEKVWIKANPGLRGKTPFRNIDEMRRMCKEAQEIVGNQNAFRRLYLNQWTEQATRWLEMSAWNACPATHQTQGRRCFVGLDLASTTDLAAAAFLFPDDGGFFDLVMMFWVPSDKARSRSHRDRVPYEQWIKDGHIRATEGDVIDYDVIRRDLREASKIYGIEEIAIDRWNATQLTTQLVGDGFTVVPFGQGFSSMSSPTKEIEALILGKKLRHGSNPVLNWMASNVATETDAAGNIKPSKSKSTERIDGIVATVMAIGRATATARVAPSVYEFSDTEKGQIESPSGRSIYEEFTGESAE